MHAKENRYCNLTPKQSEARPFNPGGPRTRHATEDQIPGLLASAFARSRLRRAAASSWPQHHEGWPLRGFKLQGQVGTSMTLSS